MSVRSAAVIAAGSQGWVHASAYRANDIDVVAIADVDLAAASSLATDLAEQGMTPRVYGDLVEMLGAERPDVVSVCTPPAFHPAAVRAAVEAGVRAVHCEKPVALSPRAAREMVRGAAEAGVQLTFNLQRRFEPVQRFAADQLRAGAIGDVVSIEGYCPNLGDWGSHIVDLILFHRDDVAPDTVFGQVDVSVNRTVYGAVAETASITRITWSDGVSALVATGREPAVPVLNLENGLGIIVQGTRGRIDVHGARCVVYRFGAETVVLDSPFDTDPDHWERGVDPAIVAGTTAAIADLVAALDEGREPVLAARHALLGTEIVFGTYESSRSRRRVPVPVDVDDNPLTSGLEAGFWNPVGELHGTW